MILSNTQDALKRYWGYDALGPSRKEIVRNLLNGGMFALVMPTAAGILCYQLPAVAAGKTAIVVSPLIALDAGSGRQLTQMGNSSGGAEIAAKDGISTRRPRPSGGWRVRLLYLSRNVWRKEMVEWLESSVSFFAIDEAHCHFGRGMNSGRTTGN